MPHGSHFQFSIFSGLPIGSSCSLHYFKVIISSKSEKSQQFEFQIILALIFKNFLKNGICFQNCSDLMWEKKCSSDRENDLKFKLRLKVKSEFVDITRTIYLKSEKSEQFLNQNVLLTYFWRFLRSNTFQQFKLEIFSGFRNMQEKLEKKLNLLHYNLVLSLQIN